MSYTCQAMYPSPTVSQESSPRQSASPAGAGSDAAPAKAQGSSALPPNYTMSFDDEEEEIPLSYVLKAKRKRATAEQVQVLTHVFEQTYFPSTELRHQLAKQLNMTPRTVQIWFQNKRQALRMRGRHLSNKGLHTPHRGRPSAFTRAPSTMAHSLYPSHTPYPSLAMPPTTYTPTESVPAMAAASHSSFVHPSSLLQRRLSEDKYHLMDNMVLSLPPMGTSFSATPSPVSGSFSPLGQCSSAYGQYWPSPTSFVAPSSTTGSATDQAYMAAVPSPTHMDTMDTRTSYATPPATPSGLMATPTVTYQAKSLEEVDGTMTKMMASEHVAPQRLSPSRAHLIVNSSHQKSASLHGTVDDSAYTEIPTWP
ncbi:hypothetical protein H4R34_002349 [Dimargaris verticillata]|uniref:Homeobox domain-containing protein n=1 Tax=Dimargaris verticillata TaxID=2761393 RepID=A0A9W8B405_9FUNG|nr:hypothetical protein H4R34_002349 [Dimargaris verticillata]